jgi:putative PIN family toxin of toxin-antitoxin system
VKIVIDTNVLISAIFWTGNPKQLLNKVRRGEATFLISEDLLNEFKEVLMRKDKPFKLSLEEAERVVTEMRGIAQIVHPNSQVVVCKDERDNEVLECDIDGRAEYVISGDLHLLGLKSFKGVKIISVTDFLR